MSLIKLFKDEDFFPSISTVFDDFLSRDLFSSVAKGTSIPAVNILEDKDSFNLEIAAPGLKKDDFKIHIDSQSIVISSEKKEEKEEKTKKITRKEFSFSSFSRSFRLPDNIANDKISANYIDGILKVKLPKKDIKESDITKEIPIN